VANDGRGTLRAVLRRAAIAFAATLTVASVGQAQESPPPQDVAPSAGEGDPAADQSVERTRQARDEFRRGVEHYQAARYLDAIHSFQVAASLVPSADLWFNIATAYEQLARTRGEITDIEQAIAHYRRYLTERVDPPDRAAVEANIASLTERLEAARASQTVRATQGTLRVRSTQEGATVRLDGETLGQTPLDQDVRVSPGRHRLEATREGYLPFRSEVSVELGLAVTSQITLEPARTHRAITGSPIFAWVAWGLAAASLGASIGVGVHAQSLADAGSLMQDPPGMPPRDWYAEARTWSAGSDALLAATAGLAVVGIALYFIEGNAVGTVTERGGVAEE
jgi:tetratricopeptide (TPR) repeat protein